MTPPRQSTQPNELSRLVRAWRTRLNPEEIPGLSAAYPQSRRRRHVSKEIVAFLTGCSVGWYSTLERGEAQNYSDDFLNRVAYTLRLNPDEKNMLFYLATGHTLTTTESSRIECTPTIQRILDAHPWPAYVSDEAWDLVGYNEHMRRWFPWVAGHENNIMRWVFTFPEARSQLHNWDTDWAPQMFAQMQYAQARQPENKRLAAVIDEILELNADARRFVEQPLTYPHPDGDHRCLHLPLHRKVQPIELVAFSPMRASGSRFMMLVPLDADEK
jgi:transcriptional regulator with XRE-family HTH domain